MGVCPSGVKHGVMEWNTLKRLTDIKITNEVSEKKKKKMYLSETEGSDKRDRPLGGVNEALVEEGLNN